MAVSCTVRIDNDKHDELVKLAKANKRNKSFYIREAIEDYLFDKKEADIALARSKDKGDELISTEEMLVLLNKRDV
jgi:predicted transcriptional regulator